MDTKLCRQPPPSSMLAAVHSATGAPPFCRATMAAVTLLSRWPSVPWARRPDREDSSQRDPVYPDRTRRSTTSRYRSRSRALDADLVETLGGEGQQVVERQ